MPDRLSPLDASFLFAEHRTAAMHVGAVMTFAPPEHGPFDPDAFIELIGRRLPLVPRYRQKVRDVPGHLGLPVWVDDPDFDLAFHVRRSALPAPGTERGAARAGRAAAGPPARPVPPAVGGLPDRGPGRRPVRGGHQDPPRHGRRAGLDGHRGGAARPHPAAAARPRPTTGTRRRSRPRWSWPRTRRCTRCADPGTCSTWPAGRSSDVRQAVVGGRPDRGGGASPRAARRRPSARCRRSTRPPASSAATACSAPRWPTTARCARRTAAR